MPGKREFPFPLLSRKDGIDLIRRELGLQVSLSKIERDVADGGGPEPCAKFGKRLLYTAEEWLRYGKGLVEDVPPEGMPAGPGRPPRKVLHGVAKASAGKRASQAQRAAAE